MKLLGGSGVLTRWSSTARLRARDSLTGAVGAAFSSLCLRRYLQMCTALTVADTLLAEIAESITTPTLRQRNHFIR